MPFSKEVTSSVAQDKLIQHELIHMLYRDFIWSHIASLVLAVITVVVLWEAQFALHSLAWLASIVVVFIFRWMLKQRFMRAEPGFSTILHWAWFYTAGAFASGFLWGLLPWVMLNTASISNIVYIVLVHGGLVVGALGIQSRFLPAYVAFTAPIVTLMCIHLMIEGGDFQVIGILVLLFLVVMLIYARDYHRLMYLSIRKKFENISLIKELEKRSEVVEKASRDKTRFLAAASHDLRQPHQAAGLFVESLAFIEKDPNKQVIIDKIRVAYRSMSSLLDQLLDISKLDTGVERPQIVSIKLQPLLQSIYLEYVPLAEQKALSLRLRPTEAVVTTDPAMLKRMLGNLVSNAIAYTSEGGVFIGVRKSGALWRVHVWDTGCGIAHDQLDSVFDEFTQLHNPERDQKKGLGLGLAIVKRMEGLIHAPVAVYSKPSRGSLFTVDLTRGSKNDIEMDTLLHQQDISLSGIALVVIDDDQSVLDSIGVLLKTWGCTQVFSFASEEAAVASMRKSTIRPHAIISDYRLRDHHTGVAAIRALHALYDVDIPALLITGDTAPDRIKEVKDSGFALLHKPVNLDDFKRWLIAAIAQENCKIPD